MRQPVSHLMRTIRWHWLTDLRLTSSIRNDQSFHEDGRAVGAPSRADNMDHCIPGARYV